MPPPQDKQSQSQSTGFGNVNGGGERVNMLVAKRSNKKRANLTTQVGSVPTAAANGNVASSSSSVSAPPASKRAQLVQDVAMSNPLSHSASSPTSFPSPSEQPFDEPSSWSRHVGMDLDVPIDSLDTVSPINAKGKRKAIIDLTDEVRTTKARTLGGDRPRDVAPVKVIGSVSSQVATWSSPSGINLPVPTLLTSLTAEIEGSDDMFEARNSEDDGMWFIALGFFFYVAHFVCIR